MGVACAGYEYICGFVVDFIEVIFDGGGDGACVPRGVGGFVAGLPVVFI